MFLVTIEPAICEYFDVKGMSNMLTQSPTFLDTLEEVALAAQSYTNTPPHVRLGYEIVKAALFVNQWNAARRVKEKPIDAARFGDLLKGK